MSDECQECLVINLYFGFVFLLIKLVRGEVMVKWYMKLAIGKCNKPLL